MSKSFLITITCFMMFCTLGLATKAPIDLSDTVWALEGSLVVNLPRVDRFKTVGQVDLTFNACTFNIVDNQGNGFQGDFALSGKKTVLTADAAALQTYLENKIQKIATAAQATISTNALADITSKLSAKPKSGMNELGLNINIKLTAKADIQADGQVLVGKLNINLKEKGTIPLPFTGTCWDFAETKPGQRWPALGA